MSRFTLAAALATAAFAVPALATDAFVSADIDTTGFYYGNHGATGAKTREQANAELQAAIADRTMAEMSRNRSHVPSPELASRLAQHRQQHRMPMVASGQGEIEFEAPAAGGRTRESVLRELERARADGSLRRTNTNRGY